MMLEDNLKKFHRMIEDEELSSQIKQAERVMAEKEKLVSSFNNSYLGSPIEHLTLHYQVRHLNTSDKSELHKLQQLKDKQGLGAIYAQKLLKLRNIT
ncbi:hypothetical protein JHK85_001471 [Glycine max]|nr:hypothetical protein JHK85_001471 [Glycine max]